MQRPGLRGFQRGTHRTSRKALAPYERRTKHGPKTIRSRTEALPKPYEAAQTTAKYAKYATAQPNPAPLHKTQLCGCCNPNGQMHVVRVQGPVFPCAAYGRPALFLVSSFVRQPFRSSQRNRRHVRAPYEPRTEGLSETARTTDPKPQRAPYPKPYESRAKLGPEGRRAPL